MKLAGKMPVIQMENEPNNRHNSTQEVRFTEDDYIRMLSLLERYRNFNRQFVFSCKCFHDSEESLSIGAHFNELEAEFKLFMNEIGRFDAIDQPLHPFQRLFMKKLPNLQMSQPTSNGLNGQLNHLQRSRLVHNESPQQQQSPQVQHHQSNHHQMSFNSASNNLSANSPSSRLLPLTTTITLSEEDDEMDSPSNDVIVNHQNQQQNVQVNQLYLKNIQQSSLPNQHLSQLSPNTSARLISQIKAAQQQQQQQQPQLVNGHQQQNNIIHSNTFPIIQNTSNETILIHATMATPTSNTNSLLSTKPAIAISSHTVNSNSNTLNNHENNFTNHHQQTMSNSNGNSNNYITVSARDHLLAQSLGGNVITLDQLRNNMEPQQQQQLQQQQSNILKIVNHYPTSSSGSIRNSNSLLATIASNSNELGHLSTSVSPTQLMSYPSRSSSRSTPTSSNQPQRQHTFQTVEQLEAQFSPQSQTQAQPQAAPPVRSNSTRTSTDSPIFKNPAVSSASSNVATTLSVIHPNQAYILSNQSLAPQTQHQAQPHLQPNTSQVVEQIVRSASTPPAPQIQLVYPQATSTPISNSQHSLLKRKLKLTNTGTAGGVGGGSSIGENGHRVIITSTDAHRHDVVKTLTLGSLPSNSPLNDTFVSNLSTSSMVSSPMGTPIVSNHSAMVSSLSLSSSSSASSSSSINSLIAKSILANHSTEALANFVLNDSVPVSPSLAISQANREQAIEVDLLLSRGYSLDANGYWRCNHDGCNFVSTSNATFLSHVHKAHAVQRPYRCTVPGCDAQFKEKYKLKVHAVVHTGEKPYPCDWPGCTARFSQSGHVSRHRRTHIGTPKNACDWPGCTRSFIQKHTLKYHQMMHRGEKPWICDIDNCGRAFIEKWKLVKHQKAHDPNRLCPQTIAQLIAQPKPTLIK